MIDARHSAEEPDPELEAAWAEELRSRVRAFRAGEMTAISLEQAMEEAERLLEMEEAEIPRHVEEIERGEVELLPGEQVMSELQSLVRDDPNR